ncbi:hypothetical protein P0W64_05255 [Tsukamurella sp. 8F]|uniref:DUF7373 family lipoprotein n=1 Tax=unclassified Tsukamurella TaxID=2633480 RepID=UPI0023B8BC78|nr:MULTISPECIES: hypothetical protein [unclassified Tsukamurella]MDF0528357.1 hypothetical protein [Tsukamurella sp. 8J]MDF0586182.1 hypothetical protein [Tsukamurella sp. 8F]
MRLLRVLALAAMCSIGSCATTVPGTPTTDPSRAVRLDVGNYPTSPRTVLPAARPADAYQQEGWRIADAVITMTDVDGSLVKTVTRAFPLISTKQLAPSLLPHFTADQAAELGRSGWLAGYVDNRGDVAATTGRWGSAGLLRFKDAASAERALTAITPAGAFPAPSVPGARVSRVRAERIGGRDLVSLVAQKGEVWAVAAAFMPDARSASAVAERALQAQAARFPDYRPSALDRTDGYPMDSESMMSLVLPAGADKRVVEYGLSEDRNLATGYRSARAELHLWSTDDSRYALVQGADAQAVASSGDTSYVTRFATSAAAKKYFDGQYALPATGSDWQIPGVSPTAGRCMIDVQIPSPINETKVTRVSMCGVQVGRYVHETAAPFSAKARQQAAASYLILQSAPR